VRGPRFARPTAHCNLRHIIHAGDLRLGTVRRMSFVSLADFIEKERITIVAEWETFARSLLPDAGGMSPTVLRDHADEILTAIVADMRSRQTAAEQAEKSKGRGEAQHMGEMGRLHATLRIEFGFKLSQMVAEYRALRASVLRLWEKKGTDPGGVTRFNEAIDEALTEAVARFTVTAEHYRDQSLGILGHDLRNPLSAIVTGATLLISSPELSDRSVSVAARMLNSANRINRMIADLLDLTRTRFGESIPVLPAPIDLDPLCRQVVAELEGLRTGGGGIRFIPKGDLRGEWDSDRIAQVLSNLLRNAIQHGGKTEPISLAAEDRGDEILLEVHNGGPSIPASVLTTIFEPMVRHATDKTNTGLGLGLYIASQVVLAHGGTLDVTSTNADGTTFVIKLPRHPVNPTTRTEKPHEGLHPPRASR
jgi:signal transduction histidine kinase